MKIKTLFRLTHQLPLFVICIAITLAIVVSLNVLNAKTWKESVNSFSKNEVDQLNLIEMGYTSEYITTFFNKTLNDLNSIISYASLAYNGGLNVVKPFPSYFSVKSVNTLVPLSDVDEYSMNGSIFQKGVTSSSQISDPFSSTPVKSGSILDNVFRAIFKSSSDTYIGIYMGFPNKFYRFYPYVDFSAYPTFSFQSYPDNVQTTGYDPSLRMWYVIAAGNDQMHLTNVYIDALTGKALITMSKRMIDNSGNLVGVVGIDFDMSGVDFVITKKNFFSDGSLVFVMDASGNLISYPNLDRTQLHSVFTVENKVDVNVWKKVITSFSLSPLSISTTRNGKESIVLYQYIDLCGYYLVVIYPTSTYQDVSVSAYGVINDYIIVLSVLLPILLLGVALFSFYGVKLFGRKFVKPILLLARKINSLSSNGESSSSKKGKSDVSEFEELSNSCQSVLDAAFIARNSRYEGNSDRTKNVLQSLLQVMLDPSVNNIKGASKCYSNLGSIYMETGEFDKSLDFFRLSCAYLDKVEGSENSSVQRQKAYTYMNFGLLFLNRNEIPTAMEMFRIAEESAEKSDDSSCVSRIQCNSSRFLMKQRCFGEALEKLNLAVYTISQELNLTPEENSVINSYQHCLLNLGLYHLKRWSHLSLTENEKVEELRVAEETFQKGVASFKVIDPLLLGQYLHYYAKVLARLGRGDEVGGLLSRFSNLPFNKLAAKENSITILLDSSGSMMNAISCEGRNKECYYFCIDEIGKLLRNFSGDDDITFSSFDGVVRNYFVGKRKDLDVAYLRNTRATGECTYLFRCLKDSIASSLSKGKKLSFLVFTDGADNDGRVIGGVSAIETLKRYLRSLDREYRIRIYFIVSIADRENEYTSKLDSIVSILKDRGGDGSVDLIGKNSSAIKGALERASKFVKGAAYYQT